uniref:3-dehydroquinate synthase II n=1 Tax=Candidatus Kentrum eta TaxID=2126337 RepID=A0A450UKW5_9GAMM|nr:MAG: 3-dehydroquinate synthase II [Candidatus Kentron sp. H]VFJ94054.1 MAG: 3-dehydroquinate synthase II [Candidatus Kentron sp. H]VFK00717.1 MAG: 3-dehydroquinate synthase II [Candidatus Kentron sp. H]
MKKIFWVRFNAFERNLITTALESGADALVLPAGLTQKVHALGRITVIAPDGDRKLGVDVRECHITQKSDEDAVVANAGRVPTLITNRDWTVIPLENLISKTTNLIQTVTDPQQARLALTAMEVGATGICLETESAEAIRAVGELIRQVGNERLELVRARIESTEPVGVADRVCVDTTAILQPGQGLLAGDTSGAFFLVYNENVESSYCDPQPFRVNAGAVHAYVRLPENKTGYLAEVRAGSRMLICDEKGRTFPLAVGRAKIEKRPMLIVRARVDTRPVSLIMQNAETIRLTQPSGEPISVTTLRPGDEVLVYLEEGGRHFGVRIRETVTER